MAGIANPPHPTLKEWRGSNLRCCSKLPQVGCNETVEVRLAHKLFRLKKGLGGQAFKRREKRGVNVC